MTHLKRVANEAAEITAFCLEHRGRCFPGWSDRKVFAYVVFLLVAKACAVTRFATGKIAGVAFGWPDIEAKVRERAAKGEPQFRWTIPNPEGDCLFIAEMIGDRRSIAAMFEWYMTTRDAKFLQIKKFTYRRGQLVELTNDTIGRFIQAAGKEKS
jgi:hypothetical protein